MNPFAKSRFILKSLVAAEILMFGSMALGELLIDPNLFSGFLGKPQIWSGILIETAVATLPVCLIGAMFLAKLRIKRRPDFLKASLATWVLLCLAVVGIYRVFYFPRAWKLTLLHPGILFGWLIPGVLIIACFVWFSSQHLNSMNENLNGAEVRD